MALIPEHIINKDLMKKMKSLIINMTQTISYNYMYMPIKENKNLGLY